MRSLTLIQLNDGEASERDWYLRLLSGFDLKIVRDPTFSTVQPGALYAYFSDKHMSLPASFLDRVAAAGGCGLLHLGDEYYRGDYRVYAAFSYVIRNSAAPMLDGPGVLNIPIGYSNGLSPAAALPASQRAYVWSFAGGRRPARVAMASRFTHIKPNLLSLPDTMRGERHISRVEYLTALGQSMFIPCGEGNIMLETLRPYEALEFGAIPLLPKRRTCDVYRYLLGDHPLPSFESWEQAANFLRTAVKQPKAIDALQAEAISWWSNAKEAWMHRIGDFIEHGATGEHQAALRARYAAFNSAAFQPSRAWELLRQQNLGQVGGRLGSLPTRVLRKLQSKSDKGVWALTDVKDK